MIVELFGCSGSGKSTIARQLEDITTTHPPKIAHLYSIIPGTILHRHIASERLLLLIVDIRLLHYFVIAIWRHRQLLSHIWSIWRSVPGHLGRKLNLSRSITRKLALNHYLSQRKRNDTLVVIDEGVMMIPQIVYANLPLSVDVKKLETICRLLPLPHISIFVSTARAILEQRIVERTDKPIRTNDLEKLRHFIAISEQIMDHLWGFHFPKSLLGSIRFNTASDSIETLRSLIVHHHENCSHNQR